MYNLNEQFAMASKAKEALQRIRERQNEKSASDLLVESKLNFDHSRQVFEEYTDDKFIRKTELDRYVYEQFLKNVTDQSLIQQINENIGDMLGTIKLIYEHINIEPKIYGFRNLSSVSSTEEELFSESKRIVYEHLDKNYFALTQDERSKRYKDYVTSKSYDITINENIDVDVSTEHTYKAAIINMLIENINFPFTVKCKIEELLESQIYKEVFDADTLELLWENFQEQSFNLSRILSLTC